MPNNVVEINNLSRQFNNTLALDALSLQMRPGLVYGLVGANGAGKTTLIKHLLGLLKAKQGTVRVFGLDPVAHPVEVLQRIGYLSEERDLPEWMRIDELMRYTRAFHPQWDQAYGQELLELFRLEPAKKIKQLSKGMRAQAGLIAAVAHRPELLILDEPSTGLDAVVRKDILNTLVRTVAEDGRTALFSSHLLDEVEQMSDYVFMVDRGQLVLQGDIDDIKQRHARLLVRFEIPRGEFPSLPSLLSAEAELCQQASGRTWKIVCNSEVDSARSEIASLGGEVVQARGASLQEIFLARAGRDRYAVTME
jgi:ABC-2 type transport system ATP-binding protein